MFCSNCGTKVSENDVFCPECGERIEHPQAAVQPETPAIEREPVVIPEPEPAIPETPAAVYETPVDAPVSAPVVKQKKSKKGLIIGIVAAVVALGLAAAAIFWLVPMLKKNNAKDAVVDAGTLLENVNSVHMDMKVNMNMSLDVLGQSQNFEMRADYAVNTMKEPARTHVEATASTMGQQVQMNLITYSETVDGVTVTYSSVDGGAHWTTQSGDAANVDQYKLFSVFTENIDRFEKTGTETVNGSTATVYRCELDGKYVKEALEATGMTQTMGEPFGELTDDLLKDLGSIPMTMSIDDKTGYPVHYTMDLSGIMKNLFKNLMQKAMEQSSISDIEIEIDIMTCTVDAVLSEFNAVDFEIPEEVKNPGKAHGEGIVGTWALVDGEGDEGHETVQMMLAMGMTMTFTFNADGTGNMTMTFNGETQSKDFTYTLEDGQIVIEGDGADYTLDGDRLTIELEGIVMILERQ